MARPRKPIDQLKLTGAFKKDPQRLAARLNAPQATGEIGDPPEYLKPLEQEIWRELRDQIPEGVAGISDRPAIEMMCRYLAIVRKYGITGKKGLPRGEQSLLLQYLAKYGLTAADRQRLTIVKKPDRPNPFLELDRERQQLADSFDEFDEVDKPN